MITVYFTSDARYRIDRSFAVKCLQKAWVEKELPQTGVVSLVFVGSRKSKQLSKEYLKDDQEHPVLTFPYTSKEKVFPPEFMGNLLGEIVICYPQVALYAASQDKEINKVISQFLDHAVTILANEMNRNK
ncbi:MAG: rRNA maturation RNAse YbeY [Patescibacteria group bacterium]